VGLGGHLLQRRQQVRHPTTHRREHEEPAARVQSHSDPSGKHAGTASPRIVGKHRCHGEKEDQSQRQTGRHLHPGCDRMSPIHGLVEGELPADEHLLLGVDHAVQAQRGHRSAGHQPAQVGQAAKKQARASQ
jgi:hypothetical protein